MKLDNESTYFRAGVGAVILSLDGRVMACERRDFKSWQLPQGGILPEEEEVKAIYREIREETGLRPKHLQLIGVMPNYLSYRVPTANRKHGVGQTHRWFAFRYIGDDKLPKLPPRCEFRTRVWVPFKQVINAVSNFKKPVYQEVEAWLIESGVTLQ